MLGSDGGSEKINSDSLLSLMLISRAVQRVGVRPTKTGPPQSDNPEFAFPPSKVT